MASLYDISIKLQTIIDNIEENGGEVTEEQMQELVITEDNFKEKLDEYRKAYSYITDRVAACKNEETRIKALRKSRENAATRIKNSMLDAVLQFGSVTKTGTKCVELDTCKLSTRKSSSIIVDKNLIQILKDISISILNTLYDNDALEDNSINISIDEFIDTLNRKFVDDYPYESKDCMDKYGHLFTEDDLRSVKFNITFNVTIDKLLTKAYSDVNIAFLNHYAETGSDDKTLMIDDSSATDFKYYLDENSNIVVASKEVNENLAIR